MGKRKVGILVFAALAIVFIVLLSYKTFKKSPKIGSVVNREELKEVIEDSMKLTSGAFENNKMIPGKYTCDGENVSPPLEIANVASGTQSLALIVDDPDAPGGDWAHWLVWNIDPIVGEISEDSVFQNAIQGTTDFGKTGYGGPCPPSGTHRYQFKLYALDTKLDLESGARKKDLEAAMKDHILEQSTLVGLYKRQ